MSILVAVPDDSGRSAIHWADCLARWSAYLSVTGLSEVTIHKYRRTLTNVIADTMLDLNALTEDDVVAYLARLDPHGAMRGEVLRALRSYCSWAEDHELTVSPVRRLKPRNPKYGDAPALSEEEITRLLYALASREPRRAWTVLLLYGTGARIASACALRPVDVHGGRIHFTRAVKGDRPYSVPMEGPATVAVQELLALGLPTLVGVGPTRVRQWLDQAEDETGVRVWPHLFRHTFATRIAPEVDPRDWMELMNHRDLSQYRRYVKPNDQGQRAAMRGL